MGYDLREHGVPTVDKATCTGCGRCVRVCPDEVLVLDDGKPRPGRGTFLGCIACGHCAAVCPVCAIEVSGRGMLSGDQIDLPAPELRATFEQFEAMTTARRSIRRFQVRDVPRDALECIVSVAATAPMGIPPHEVGVVVLTTPSTVQAFAEDACRAFGTMGRLLHPVALAMMRPFIGKSQYEAFRHFIRPLLLMLSQMRKQKRDMFTYDAAAAMLFHVGPMGDPADCAIVATYAMLAAESLGLGSCMLGTSVALTRDRSFKAKYGIPEANKLGVSLALGYPAVEFRHGIRRRLASVKYL